MALIKAQHGIFGLFLIFACIMKGLNCCEPRKPVKPELLFPGISSWRVVYIENENEIMMKGVSSIVDLAIGSIPGGSYLSAIWSGCNSAMELFDNADEKFADLVDRRIGVEAFVNVQAQISAVKHRIRDIWEGRSQMSSLTVAWNECTVVLNKYKSEHGGLFVGKNHLISGPSLVAFSGIYTGVALMRVNLFPSASTEVKEGLESLKDTLSMYRDAVVMTRLNYLEYYKPGPYLAAHGFGTECNDKYADIVPNCESCKKYDCPEYLTGDYKKELTNLYENYFDEARNRVVEVIRMHRAKFNWWY